MKYILPRLLFLPSEKKTKNYIVLAHLCHRPLQDSPFGASVDIESETGEISKYGPFLPSRKD